MAPEQASGGENDATVDVYALGVMLYELTTGSVPFRGDSPAGVLLGHLNEVPAPPRSINPNLPQAVEQIIQKALAKYPTERYPSAQELLGAIDLPTLPGTMASSINLMDTVLSNRDDGRCPYRGLETFETQHAEFFFGRESLIERLENKLSQFVVSHKSSPPTGSGSLRRPGEWPNRFLAILGASGSGKSSLVQAGLVPMLQQDVIPNSNLWRVVIMKPGSHPLEELAVAVNRYPDQPEQSLSL